MTWFGWILLTFYILNVGATILLIGKKREITTPVSALISCLISGAVVAGLLLVGSGHL